VRSFVRGLAWISAIAGAIGLLLYLFVFDTWVVRGDPTFLASVEPNLRAEDRILTRRGQVPSYGQLARCFDPRDVNAYVVGRVFGRGGDTVLIQNENVFINGVGTTARHGCAPVVLTHPATGNLITLSCSVEENPAWTYGVLHRPNDGLGVEGDVQTKVEPGKLFLVSDDRHLHQDSRDFGQVDETTCEHVVFRLWGASYVDSSRRNTILW
jgi:signal peptidase I